MKPNAVEGPRPCHLVPCNGPKRSSHRRALASSADCHFRSEEPLLPSHNISSNVTNDQPVPISRSVIIDPSMISGRSGCELAVLAVFCILSIFLFPAMQGPYSVVHGSATALLAARAAFRLRGAIAQATLASSLAGYLVPTLTFLAWIPISHSKSRFAASSESVLILRC